MAETTTKIFTVDTGKAITNLKEYKAYLDELKGALLGLEQGTDEYNKTAKALREGQQKLNDVIDVAKGKNTAAADSYDALNKKLVELRRSYRALSEENRDGIVGARMLEEIKTLDTKLKGLDADMGQFFRNVGDYKNAFADAFDKMLGPMGKVGGTFGKLANDVKGMIPLIKSVNSTAVKGLSGIKAAIASTGIGLLIVAVGELAANWDAVSDALDRAFGGTSKLIMDAEQLKNYFAEANYQLDLTIKKMEIMGATEWEINEFRLKQNSKRQEEIDKMVKTNNDIIENGTAAERKRAAASNEALGAEYDTLVVEHSRLIDNREIIKLKEDAAKKSKEAAEEEKKAADAARQGAQATSAWQKEMEALKNKATALGQTLEDSVKNPFEKLDEEYEKNVALLDTALEKRQISEEQYAEWKEILDKKHAEDWTKIMQDAWKDWQDEQVKIAKDTASKSIKEIEKTLKNEQNTLKLKWRLDDTKKIEPEKMGFKDFFKTLFSNEEVDKWLDEQTERINKLYDPQIAASEQKIKAYDDEIAKLKELGAAQEEIDAVEELKRQEELDYLNLKTEKQIENNEAINESEEKLADLRQKRINVMAQGVEAVGNLMNNLASMMTNQIQQEVKEGKISESEAKKKFKTIKAMQYASAVMTTAAGVAAALAGVFTTKSGPWDYVLAGIQAASIAAGGAIQIATIARQKFDTSGGGNSITTPDLATVTNEYKPEYVQNIQTQSELSELSNAMGQISPVVTVSDIEDGLQTSKVRVEENSF